MLTLKYVRWYLKCHWMNAIDLLTHIFANVLYTYSCNFLNKISVIDNLFGNTRFFFY